jgi:hypothetical protein
MSAYGTTDDLSAMKTSLLAPFAGAALLIAGCTTVESPNGVAYENGPGYVDGYDQSPSYYRTHHQTNVTNVEETNVTNVTRVNRNNSAQQQARAQQQQQARAEQKARNQRVEARQERAENRAEARTQAQKARQQNDG